MILEDRFDDALAVARQACVEGLTETLSDDQIVSMIDAKIWRPEYPAYEYVGTAHRR